MKALSICQPWAWAIVNGIKTIENRTWQTQYRGPLLIHASRSETWLRKPETWVHLLPTLPQVSELTRGAIVGSVNVIECVPLPDVENDPFAIGPWCHIYKDAQELVAPIPFRGSLSYFDVPNELLRYRRTQKNTS